MRSFGFAASAGICCVLWAAASSAVAGEKPLTGAVPAWVKPAPEPSIRSLPQSGNVFPLFDEQVSVQGRTVTVYFDTAVLITSPEVLQKAGTISYSWQPDHGDLTFHRIEILRGDDRIDALAGGRNLTVLRREAGLESKMVDGRLTAVQHLEGLRVGDVLRITVSISETDDVLAGNVQDGLVLIPAPVQIGFGRSRLVWPKDKPIAWKALTPGVTATPQPIDGDRMELNIPLPVAKPPEMPKNYPSRFTPIPLITFTSFHNWSEVKAVMAPLYRATSPIAAGSDLERRVDAIAQRSTDPIQRMADALQLVQDDVRYQLIALGNGNYVPQAAADTWAKRYGDCKAKTALLLAVLGRLGIKAEPVLAHTLRGDSVREAPPSPMAFNHIFVRAEVDGESYWLDGTMLGSRREDLKDVPFYGTVLPLFAPTGDIVDLPRRAHARPDFEVNVAYDMSAGPHLPAPFRLEVRYGGLLGASKRIEGGGDVEERLKTFAEKEAKDWTGSDDVALPQASYDPASAVWTVRVAGVSYPDWQFHDGQYELNLPPKLKVFFDAQRGKSSWRAIPAVLADPWTAKSHVSITLPGGGRGAALTGSTEGLLALPVADWRRKLALSGAEVTEDIVSRESPVEVAPENVSRTHKAINDAMSKAGHVDLPADYPARWDDVPRMRTSPAMLQVRAVFDGRIADKPDDATRLGDRAWFEQRLLNLAAAEQDYGRALAVDGSAKRYLDRARVRASRADHTGALEDAQAAYDLEEGSNAARGVLATELTYAGRVEQALDLLPTDADMSTDRGIGDFLQRVDIEQLGGRFDEAAEQLDSALTKHPRMAKLLNARCWLRGLRNAELEGALADCNKALELASEPATYLDSRAMIHFRGGRYAEALADYESALAADPEYLSSLFMSAIVLDRMGQKDKAAARLRAVRMLYPNIDQYFGRYGIKA